MKKYHIYHPERGEINHDCSKGMSYEHVATVEATSMHHAFAQAQNDFNPKYERLELRSSCVGDLIRPEDEKDPYMIKGMGFEQVKFTDILSEDDGPVYEEEYIDFEMV